MTLTPFKLALQWAERGVKVFPLGDNKMPLANCSKCRMAGHQPKGCGCAAQGKPCHGFYAATTDTDLLYKLFSNRRAACVGIATGASGLIVVDCDVAKGSTPPLRWTAEGLDEDTQEELVSTRDLFEGEDFCTTAAGAALVTSGLGVYSAALSHREVEHVDTWTVLTPSGGVHYVYRSVDADCFAPDNRSFPLVDVKTGGSYVVASGSVAVKGEYRHMKGSWPPAEAPEWLVEHLDRPSRRSSKKRAEEVRMSVGNVVEIEVSSPESYVWAALERAAKAVRTAPLGEVYDTIRRKTFCLAPLVNGGSLDAERVVNELAASVPPGAEARVPDVRRCLEGALGRVHAERVVAVGQHDDEEFEFEVDASVLWEGAVRKSMVAEPEEIVEAYLEALREVELNDRQEDCVRRAVGVVGALLEGRRLAGGTVMEHLLLVTDGLSVQRVRELASEGIKSWRSVRSV